jgi:hypothetical protein
MTTEKKLKISEHILFTPRSSNWEGNFLSDLTSFNKELMISYPLLEVIFNEILMKFDNTLGYTDFVIFSFEYLKNLDRQGNKITVDDQVIFK